MLQVNISCIINTDVKPVYEIKSTHLNIFDALTTNHILATKCEHDLTHIKQTKEINKKLMPIFFACQDITHIMSVGLKRHVKQIFSNQKRIRNAKN